jgi:transcriptional regulator with XRE-family HTH domain
MDLDLGLRIRLVREQHSLSQRELARRSGVSNTIVSMIEQNRANPSVGLLKRILDGVPMSLADFFSMEAPQTQDVFFRRDQLFVLTDGPVKLLQVGRNLRNRRLQVLHEHFAPGADSGDQLLQHEGEEGGIVVAGMLEVTVGDLSQALGPGDAYYFDSRIPHRMRNLGSEEAVVVSACTPPTF